MKFTHTRSKPAVRQAVYLVLISALIGILANAVNPRGISFRLQAPEYFGSEALTNVQPGQKPPLVDTGQIRQLLDSKAALLIDARSAEEYASGHIPAAINIPYEDLFNHLDVINGLPPQSWLICYCDGPPCDLAHLLAVELVNMGYMRVAVYEAGLDAWKKSESVVRGKEQSHE